MSVRAEPEATRALAAAAAWYEQQREEVDAVLRSRTRDGAPVTGLVD